MIDCFHKNRHVYLTGYDVSDSRNVSTTRTQQLGPTALASTNVRDSSKQSPTSSALLIKANNWQTEGYFHKYSQFSAVPNIPQNLQKTNYKPKPPFKMCLKEYATPHH